MGAKRFLRRHGPGSRARLAEEGLEGTAVVRSVEKTMARENAEGGGRSSPVYEYRLEVTVPGRPPYPVIHRQSGWPEPGRTVVVRVDAEDHEHVLIDWLVTKERSLPATPSVDEMGAPAPFTAWMPGAPPPTAQPVRDPGSVLASGRPGAATVVNTRPSGTAPSGEPQHYFLLEVRPGPGLPSFMVEFHEAVPPDQADRVSVGADLPVRITSPDAAGVAIDWGTT